MSEPTGPLASTGFWLSKAALAYTRELGVLLRPHGLTPTQFSVLAGASFLSRDDVAPTQQEIADFAIADRMMTSKVLATLESNGLVERVADEGDRRVRRVRPTAQGRTLLGTAIEVATSLDARLFPSSAGLRDALRDVADGGAGLRR